MIMTAKKEESRFYLCLFPIQQASLRRAKWEIIIRNEDGQPGMLTLVAPGEVSNLYEGYAFIPHPQLMDMTVGMLGECVDLYINENSCRARERTKVILFSNHDVWAFYKALREYEHRMPPDVAEVCRRNYARWGGTEVFDLIFQVTAVHLPNRLNDLFKYWMKLVKYGFVPHMIQEKEWENWEQYGGHECDYISIGGCSGTQTFSYSFYGTEQSKAKKGIRDVGRYVKEQTWNHLNENRVKEFLCGINPFKCGRYVCGAKISDRTTFNNGGSGSGNDCMLYYDKEEIYRGMQETERR